jgi:hypothetical protein
VYRVAIVGAQRGLHHARGYEHLGQRARVVAVADLDPARRAAAEQALGVTTYGDWLTMLHRERPDVLHAVTSPLIPRAGWVEPAADAGVRMLVIEKPLALSPGEGQALTDAVRRTSLRVVVNQQRRYMPFASTLLHLLAPGGLGPVHFVRASTMGKAMDLGPHLLDLGLLALGDDDLTRVWAAADGIEADPQYPGPRRLFAGYRSTGGARLLVEAAPEGDPPLGDRDFAASYPDFMPSYGPHRCNLDVWAERGRFWWREYGSWGYELADGRTGRVATAFKRDDLPAQQAFTAALLDWLDGGPPHRNRLDVGWRSFVALLAAGMAAHAGRPLDLPPTALDRPLPVTDAAWATVLAWLRASAPDRDERSPHA